MFRLFGRGNSVDKVLLLGLDCASPQLVFEQFKDGLPTLYSLMQGGTWGELISSTPCITIPAWSCMTTGRDPGVLGVYGFRNRSAHDYDSLSVADASAIRHPRLWDILGDKGKKSLIMNVPQTYPVRPLNGHMVSAFMTPDTSAQFAYPAIFKAEALKQVPNYAFDVRNFRNVDRTELYDQLVSLMDAQYKLFAYALKYKDWQFAMHVNIGVDRLHHAFWRYFDPQHRLHKANSEFANTIRDYYIRVDTWLAELIDIAGEDTAVIVASDHGVKRMDGAIAINEWLYEQGWLALKDAMPDTVTKLTNDMIDWENTRAWSTGGYYGRVFLNVAGREPSGMIAQSDYETVREELASLIRAIPDDKGNALPTQVFKPQEIYQEVNNIAPDLMVYFGDLHWRCVGTIGYGRHYTLENDTGPDDANHAQEGMFIIKHPRKAGRGNISAPYLLDIAPTVLQLLGINTPADMQGTSIQLTP
ncbi:MAG: alkaline phosphatase family protein [Chloroflexota bacterium]